MSHKTFVFPPDETSFKMAGWIPLTAASLQVFTEASWKKLRVCHYFLLVARLKDFSGRPQC
jgi:hypothetical protein